MVTSLWLIAIGGGGITRAMRKILWAVVIPMGCWTGSSATKPVDTTTKAASVGGSTYGGILYGGRVYGGAFASLTGTGDISSGFDDKNIYGGLVGKQDGKGWGTIGTGRYGTIGHGSGTGSGYGVRGGKVPTVSIGQPAAQGDLDKAIIRRYIKRNIQKIRYCYEKELVSAPALAGTVLAAFTIGVDGRVVSSTASGMHQAVGTCVANVIKAIEFPKPRGGKQVVVSYPFSFRPDNR